MTETTDEARFRGVFSHLGAVSAYAARRGSRDPDGVAAEVMTIAWRRLAAVPTDDPLPWLYGTARNVAYAEARSRRRSAPGETATAPAPDVRSLDPELDRALRALRDSDREALLLVAWEDLTPTQAAAALGITATAFRVRLYRARRRLRATLASSQPAAPMTQLDVEGT
ncbi:MAG TPA: sigma-70 family RNA polymerase sigma factor [Gaiellaceae bacterium]|jgi:RNA polymerase sigma-70 factor (ECF subfamily)